MKKTLLELPTILTARLTIIMICTFGFSDPFVLTYLFKSYCLSLYGCVLWSLSSHALKHLQVSINKILRRIWHRPSNSHMSIVLKTSKISFFHNMILNRFEKFISLCMESDNPVVKYIIFDSVNLAYSSIGYNCLYGHSHVKHFTEHDLYLYTVFPRINAALRRVAALE